MQVIEISGVTGHSPYDIIVCDITNTYCYTVESGIISVPPTISFNPPIQLLGVNSLIVKIIDSSGCISFQVLSCPQTPTSTPTPTITPTVTPTNANCVCLIFNNPTLTSKNYSYINCEGIQINYTLDSDTTIYVCGKNPIYDSGIELTIGQYCSDNICIPPTPTPTSTTTPTYTETPTNTPTNTPTYTETPTNTPTYTETPTNTPTYTETPTNTPTYTETPTNTPTTTPTYTETPTNTPTPTLTNTPTTNTCITYIVSYDNSPFYFDATFTFTPCCTNVSTSPITISEFDTGFGEICSSTPPVLISGSGSYVTNGACEYCDVCYCWDLVNNNPFTEVTFYYVDCSGNPSSVYLPINTSTKICSSSKVVTDQLGFGISATRGSSCIGGFCPTPTPTPTLTQTPSPTPSITPSFTPTKTVTPTKTPTPSTVPAFVGLASCDVMFAKSNPSPNFLTYKVSTNITQTISTPIVNTTQIGRTSNRLWLENGSTISTTYISEYNLVENPYSVSLLRTISIANLSSNKIFRGYNSLNSTTLLSYTTGFPSSLYELDITTTTAVETYVWGTTSSRSITGNLLYTTNGRVIYLNYDNSVNQNYYLTQKVYATGVQEFDVYLNPAISNSFVSLFQEGNAIYIVTNSPTAGLVYRVNPTNSPVLTLVGTMNVNSSLGHAAQPSTCITIPIDPIDWDGVL